MKKTRPFILKTALTTVLLVLTAGIDGAGETRNRENRGETAAADSALYSGLRFRSIGPALMSGRISYIAVHPERESTWYVAAGSGNVWKTENAGTTWTPVFDDQASYSIGCVTIDPRHPETVWVGTGEKVSGRHVGWGDGVYKSLDGGKTWKNMGLHNSEHISRILIDPRDSRVVYVAAEGPLWSSGGDRGVYKTEDGGQTWTHSLNISPDTGVSDAVMDPNEPDILYAAAYQRRRSAAAFMAGGPESGLYKSSDGGKTWKKLTAGLPRGDMGRIGLAVSPIHPRFVYATIEAGDEEKGFYRSSDWGESWEKRSSYISGGTGPHYYQKIFADPHRFDRVYQMDVWTHVTDDGGKTWSRPNETHKHSDNHALAFTSDPNHLISGTDGGLYQSFDQGQTWSFFANLPVTQFYKLALDNAEPFYNVHGGTQDNSSQIGPSRTLNENGIRNSDWAITTGADGHDCAFDPADPNIVYAEMQNGALHRYDRRTGELVDIRPSPGLEDDPYRFNWDAPVIISPHSPTRLYFAAQYVFRSNDRGDSWTRISPDLTRNIFRLEQKIMDRTWSADALWDHGAMSLYGTISTISESPLAEGLIYAGTDDGLIQITEDGGRNWRRAGRLPGVPEYAFANRIRASRHDPDTVYAALDNHKAGDFKPYILKSTDRGRTWALIAGGLPEKTIVWSVIEDHVKKGLLFLGTEFGIYFSPDDGGRWIPLKGGLPTISFRDIEIQERENDLVGASFGRGFYILDDYSPLRHINTEMLAGEGYVFPVRKALLYVPRSPLSLRGKAFLGDGYFMAPNPPFGAVITYYLRDSFKTLREERLKKEKAAAAAGENVAFPGWERLREEEKQEKPAVILTIKDEEGRVVRRIEGPATSGIHRVAWDLRYPPVDPVQLTERSLAPWSRPPSGPLVAPGRFTVSLSKRIDGAFIPLGKEQPLIVESLQLSPLQTEDRQALLAFQKKAGALQRALMGAAGAAQEAARQIPFMKKALMDTPGADAELFRRVTEFENRLRQVTEALYGDRTARRLSEPSGPSLLRMVNAQLRATAPITETNRRSYEEAAGAFDTLQENLRQLIEIDLKKLSDDLEAAGAPWTPGRGVPVWKKK